jgi:N-methylhydantoinase A
MLDNLNIVLYKLFLGRIHSEERFREWAVLDKGGRMGYYIGTDIGGTFTDTVVMDEEGQLSISKVPSTPLNFAQGLTDGLMTAAENRSVTAEEMLGRSRLFIHGCTVATNTLINHSGAKVGMITTRGFEDTMEIMRATSLVQGLPVEAWYHKGRNPKPFPVIPRDRVVGVKERVDWKGAEVVILSADEVRSAADFLIKEKGCEALAVCFLWSFVNPEHELEARKIINEAFPDIYVDCSHQIVGLIGEYERFSTTVLNSYLRPEVEGYVSDLEGRLDELGLGARLLVMLANGGSLYGMEAAHHAVSMVGSGPTGGVLAGKLMGELIGDEDIITTDMGGTSFDISIIARGEIHFTKKSTHERHAVGVPMAEIESIGAGGGSIAYIEDGIMKVGPRSAGMDPGPVCYGRGGTEPTVTDADAVLGFLNPEFFLGGKMPLDKEGAERAIKQKLADPLGISTVEAASGIYQIVNAHMADAIRFHALQRGYDPRDFTIFAFGGAGPMHAVGFGEEIGARAIMVPLSGLSTVLSAFGICNSDVVRNYFSSIGMPFPPEDLERLNEIYARMEERGMKEIAADGFEQQDVEIQRSAGMRYHFQLTDVDITVPGGVLDEDKVQRIQEEFDRRYAELYGEHAGFKESGRDLINEFVRVVGRTPKGRMEQEKLEKSDASAARKGERPAYFPSVGEFVNTFIYDGDVLRPGNVVTGPAVLEMTGTTVVVSPGCQARLDPYRNIYLEGEGKPSVSQTGGER